MTKESFTGKLDFKLKLEDYESTREKRFKVETVQHTRPIWTSVTSWTEAVDCECPGVRLWQLD